METYNGIVRTSADAIILFEACRIGLLPRVQRRLSEKERQSIKSGSVFVWDEREAGMRRWTDGKSWSASRVSGSFLTYREMEGKRGGSNMDKSANRDGVQGNEADSDGGGPDGYRYKADGMTKQSFSITTNNGQHLHLISYFSRASATTQNLMQPSNDPQLRHIRPEKGMYPESTVHEQSTIPAVTRGPMNSPGYTQAPHQGSPYARGTPYGYQAQPWSHSPMTTPPAHPGYGPYYQQQPYPGQSALHHMQYPPHPGHYQHGQMTAYDRPPPPMGGNGLPPPPGQYGPPAHGSYPPPHSYHHPYPYPANAYQQPYQHPPAPQQSSYPPPRSQAPQSYQRPDPAAHDQSARRDERPASGSQPPPPASSLTQTANGEQAQSGAPPVAPAANSTAGTQTIPSISSMLNGAGQGDAAASPRASSHSPGGTSPRPLQDIPSHKLGFEANRDMQALRNLDKSTLKY